MNQRTKDKAIQTLENMKVIVKNEMVQGGAYVHPDKDPTKSNSICQGHRYCLLGTAWISYGVKLERDPDPRLDNELTLPGVLERERLQFLRNRPGLKAVYDALNNAAERKIARDQNLDLEDYEECGRSSPTRSVSIAEALFEDGELDRRDLLNLINSAKREIVKA